MRAYSVDLRERIVQSRKEGHRLVWIAQTFGVSISSIKRYCLQYRQTGGVTAKRGSRQKARINERHDSLLEAQVVRMSDATLLEHVLEWERTTGIWVSEPTMCRALKRLRQTRKKDSWRARTQ